MIPDCGKVGAEINMSKKEFCCIKHQGYWQDIFLNIAVWGMSENDFRLKYGITKEQGIVELNALSKIISLQDLGVIVVNK